MDAIICMAGSARRLNLGQNKVYLKLNDQMIFTYSLNKLAKYCQQIILSIREEDLDLVRPYLNDQVSYVFGGSERYHSVYNAISKCEANTILIHDGARPFISDKTIQAIIAASQSADLVLPYLPLKGTIYQNEPLKLLNRANTISAQTPQLVKKDYFIKSYLEAIKDNFIPTDDISLILKYFPDLKVAKVLDEEMNFKITTQFDLDLARRLIW